MPQEPRATHSAHCFVFPNSPARCKLLSSPALNLVGLGKHNLKYLKEHSWRQNALEFLPAAATSPD